MVGRCGDGCSKAAYAAAYASDPDYSRFALRIYHTAKAHHLRGRGDEAGAIESQRLAAHYDPDFARAHLGLGLALLQAGQRDEARASLTRARTLEPGNLRTLRALARDAEFRRAFAEAIALRREILERAPDRLSNRNNLAWLLATAPDPADRRPREALELARALIETQAEPSANLLDTLAAAEAAAGNYDMAASVAKRAADLAGEAGQDALAAEIANRETRYRRQRPYHETPP
jgi:Flp pilus assembly protein TadD